MRVSASYIIVCVCVCVSVYTSIHTMIYARTCTYVRVCIDYIRNIQYYVRV